MPVKIGVSLKNYYDLLGSDLTYRDNGFGFFDNGGLLAIPILWEKMHDYQKNRILAFIDPSVDPTGNGWHTRQSIFAVGSGKLWVNEVLPSGMAAKSLCRSQPALLFTHA